MLGSIAIRLSEKRYIALGALVVALLAIVPLSVSAAGISGDAAYDPAAGGHPDLFVPIAWGSLSGDDAYDPAAGSYPQLFVRAAVVDLSGDVAYDPAAGGLSELAGNWPIEGASCPVLSLAEVGSYSGDDAYDPAAGGRPELVPLALACAR